MKTEIIPLQAQHLKTADRVHRLAFGHFLGLENPLDFEGDARIIDFRFNAENTWMFGAFSAQKLMGAATVTHHGAMSLVGPVTVLPEFWDQGIGKKLMQAVMDHLNSRNSKLSGLFTFPQSSKHVSFYQNFGFWPASLIAVMQKKGPYSNRMDSFLRASRMSGSEQKELLSQSAELTHGLFPGWDLSAEISALLSMNSGECIVLKENGELKAFALCHFGRSSEGGSGQCFIKAAAVSRGNESDKWFNKLIASCESLTEKEKLPALTLGIHTCFQSGYRILLKSGFRLFLQGIAMIKTNSVPADFASDSYILGDWR